MEICCHKRRLCYGFEMQVRINLGGGGSIERPKTSNAYPTCYGLGYDFVIDVQ